MEVPGDPAPVPVRGGGGVNKEAEEGRREHVSQSTYVLSQEMASNPAFQYLI